MKCLDPRGICISKAGTSAILQAQEKLIEHGMLVLCNGTGPFCIYGTHTEACNKSFRKDHSVNRFITFNVSRINGAIGDRFHKQRRMYIRILSYQTIIAISFRCLRMRKKRNFFPLFRVSTKRLVKWNHGNTV
jgi:hypothetical protein